MFVTWTELNDKLLSLLEGVQPDSKIWDHGKIDIMEIEADNAYKDISGKINTWIFRRYNWIDETAGLDEEVDSTIHWVLLEFWYQLGDNPDERRASERAFQKGLDDVHDVLKADTSLGFGNRVVHYGMGLLTPILKPQSIANGVAHHAICLLKIWTGDC